MSKSPIALALSLALLSAPLMAADSFDQALNKAGEAAAEKQSNTKINEQELTNNDKATAQAKRKALTGAIYEDEQLKELRDILTEGTIKQEKSRQEKVKFPMEADEIRKQRSKIQELERAAKAPLSSVNFNIRNITYNPEDNKPIVISMASGYSAQVEFYDASGQPWSIRKDGVVGDADSFSRKVMGEKRHIASFTLTQKFQQSNAAIVLEGLTTSIPVLLRATDGEVDGRLSVTIPKIGPNAEIQPVFNNELDNVSPELVKLQSGDAPAGAKLLRVAGIDNAEVWFDGEFMYLSLPGRLLIPPPINSSASPTGRFLYKTMPATYISASVNGARVSGTIEGLYQADIRRERTVFEKEVK